MAQAQPRTATRAPWPGAGLLAPGLWAVALWGGLSTWYVFLAVDLPLTSLGWRPLLGASVAVALLLAVLWRGASLSSAVRSPAGALRAPTDAERLAALEQLAPFADRWLLFSLAAFTVASAAMAALVVLPAGLGPSLALRLFVMCSLCGVLAALAAYPVCQLRAGHVAEAISGHLSAEQLFAATSRDVVSTRTRVVGVTVAAVVAPALLLFDVLGHRQADALAHMAVERHAALAASSTLWEARLPACLFGGVAFALALVAAWTTEVAMGRALRRVVGMSEGMAEGNLQGVRWVFALGETRELERAFARIYTKLLEVSRGLAAAGQQLVAVTTRMEAGATEMKSEVSRQASAIAESSSTTEELGRTSRQVMASAGAVSQNASSALAAARVGQNSARAFIDAVGRVRRENRLIAEAVARLGSRVEQIGTVVELISSVANRSDLLALSAELEGTRSGAVGQGFALVASQMRKLAENVLKSTREIVTLVEEIRAATDVTRGVATGKLQGTEGGLDTARRIWRSLESLVALADHTADAAHAISLATQQQTSGTDQLGEAVVQVLEETQDSVAAAQELAQTNQQLQDLAGRLGSLASRFRAPESPTGS